MTLPLGSLFVISGSMLLCQVRQRIRAFFEASDRNVMLPNATFHLQTCHRYSVVKRLADFVSKIFWIHCICGHSLKCTLQFCSTCVPSVQNRIVLMKATRLRRLQPLQTSHTVSLQLNDNKHDQQIGDVFNESQHVLHLSAVWLINLGPLEYLFILLCSLVPAAISHHASRLKIPK